MKLWKILWLTLLVGCATQNSNSNFNSDGFKNINELLEKRFQWANLPDQKIISLALKKTDDPLFRPDDSFLGLSIVSSDIQEIDADILFTQELAKYIKDPSYSCNKPIFFEYFNRRYGQKRKEYEYCSSLIPFRVVSNKTGSEIVYVDLEKVREVHLLFSGSGDSLASRFGHVLVRLIVCPDKTSTDYECAINLKEHIVLSFRAHIDELQIDTLGALNGNYKAYFYAQRFMDVYKDYAIVEFREMYSLPIKMTTEERLRLIRAFSEINWTFSGDYKYFSNNCSTLMESALSNTLSDFYKKRSAIRSIRPNIFYRNLIDSGLVISDVLDNRGTAEKLGYYFPSTRRVYEESLDYVNQRFDGVFESQLEESIGFDSVKRFFQLYEIPGFFNQLDKDRKLYDSVRLLSELSMMRNERAFVGSVARYFDTVSLDRVRKSLNKGLDYKEFELFENCLLNPIEGSLLPPLMDKGIPLNSSDYEDHMGISCESSRLKLELKGWEIIAGLDRRRWEEVKTAQTNWIADFQNLMFLSSYARTQHVR